jgi:peptide/nickel transport system permease protein
VSRFLLGRLIQAAVTLLLLSVVVFALARATGDPLTLVLPLGATDEDFANARHYLGLDQPVAVQYAKFVGNALRGDFGTSLRARRPVNDLLAERFPNSLKLAAFSMAVTLLLAFPLGVLAAARKDTVFDTAAKIVATLGQALPTFWIGIVLIEVVGGRLQWLPAGGTGGLSHYIMPGLTLGWFILAGMMRLIRSSLLEVLDSDFVRTARAKGVAERSVIWRHALRNALIPVTTFAGVYFAILVTTAIVVETVFAWPGMGRLAYEAITARDFPVIQAVVLVTAVVVVVVNISVDVIYVYIDPRIHYR